MKKRFTKMVASVCVAAALVSGLAASAYAEDTVKYTLKSGDTVLSVCQSLGIDFYANQAWITKTNNIKDYSRLKVGTVLTLPLGSTEAPSITSGTPAEGSSGDTTVKDGDFISGYLISHTLASGETVGGVCQSLGIDFDSNSDRIKELNNITSYNRVPAGKTLLLPSTKAPSSGSCIKIVAHKIVSGDTAYGICQSYGISYDSSLSMMKILNNKDDFSAIKAGQILYLPVPGTVQSSSSGSNTSTSSGNTGSTGNTGTNQPTQAKQYSIYSYFSNGTLQLQVNGNAVSKAKAGDTIKIDGKPDSGYTLSSVTVYKYGDSEKTIEVKDNSFIMPEYDVVVKVEFKAAS